MKQVLLHLPSAVAVVISSVVIIVGLVVISSGVSQHQNTHLMVSTTNYDSSSRVMKRRRLSDMNNLEL